MSKRRWTTRYWVKLGKGLAVSAALNVYPTVITITADRRQVRWFSSLVAARGVAIWLSDFGVPAEVRRQRITTDAAVLAEFGDLRTQGAP